MTDFTKTRAFFHLPEGVVYLDGNSLGPLPVRATERVARMMQAEWGEKLITGWNEAGWMAQPEKVGDRIAKLIGAAPGTVVVGDTLTIKVFQAVAAALQLNPDRKVVLSDSGNFPTDLYMARGLIEGLDQGHKLRVVDPEAVEDALSDQIAVLMLTEVDYRSGRLHDMVGLTEKARALGIVTVWDLAHSAGAMPVDVTRAGADFAVGCTYKYLNGGPGAPAFIYVAPQHTETLNPILQGWLGHDAPFAFDLDYRPAPGIARMRVGTPAMVQFAALDAALDIWEHVDLRDIRARSIELSERFIAGVEAKCPDVSLASPRDPAMRGSQVSFRHPQAYAVMQALIAQGVIGDFRAPDNLRFGITPLYLDEKDIDKAVDTLARILEQRLWDTPEFKARKAVT